MAAITLRKISKYISRGISPRYVEDDGILVLNQKCIRDQKINIGPARLTDREKKISADKKLNTFDILINSTGVGTLGRVAQIKYELDATVDSHVTIFRPADTVEGENKKVDPLYVGFCVRNQEKFIESLGTGATGQTELSKSSILDDVSIYLPEFAAQTRIASTLSAYDDLIENNEKRIKTLEDMAQLLYTEWFVKFKFPGHEKVKMVDSGTKYGWIPEGWEVVKIGDLLGKVKRVQKIQTGEYLNYGQFPIVDQGRDFIAGYTNDKQTVYEQDLIVFGDHSRCFKYCNFAFACGADGTQLLLTNDAERMPESLLYHVVLNAGLQNYSYARHFKFLKVIDVVKPDSLTATRFGTLARDSFEQIRLLRDINSNLSRTRDLLIPQLVTGKRELK